MKSKSHLAPVLTALVVMLGGGYLVGISVSQSLMTSVAPLLVTVASTPPKVTVSWTHGDVGEDDGQQEFTNESTLKVKAEVEPAAPGRLRIVVGTSRSGYYYTTTGSGKTNSSFDVALADERTYVVHAEWEPLSEAETTSKVRGMVEEAAEAAVNEVVTALGDDNVNWSSVRDTIAEKFLEKIGEIVEEPVIAAPAEFPDAIVAEINQLTFGSKEEARTAVVEAVATKVKEYTFSVAATSDLAGFGGVVPWEEQTVTFDITGPQLQSASLVDMPSAGPTLVVRFVDADANQLALGETKHYVILRETEPGKFTGSVDADLEVDGDGRTARFYLGRLTTGAYRFIAPWKAADATRTELSKVAVFTDKAGNPAGRRLEGRDGRDIVYTFSSMPERERGEHVEFPPFAPPTPTPAPPEGYNPADYVDARVAQLFYYRDAHRVAEILNRNVKSYNRAAVTQAEQRAQGTRVTAEEKTDARRKAEREAVQAADKTRNAETKLNDGRQVLREATDLQIEKDDTITRSNAIAAAHNLSGASDRTKREAYERAKKDGDQRKEADLAQMLDLDETARRADANLRRLGGSAGVGQIETYVRKMESAVADLRQAEITAQEKSDTAQASEDRAIEEQFRQEVAAAHEDPDTYVPGKVDSRDPVTQVSISVIGEGLIHLRGPMRGINKIRAMINQIDTPVGQIKISIETIQVNGEDGDAMEEVVGRIQGEIDLGRSLTSQSLNLLRKAIQIEAGLVAEAAQTGGNYQVDRDRKYLYTFYGRDFIDELYAIDSEFLRTENAILSLHSMDTISLNRALFTLALAKNDIRERIMCRFLASAKTELPDAEFDFRRSSELRPHHTQKHFPPWNLAHLPLWNKPRIETVIREAVDRNACQRYHFRNIRGFFDVGFGTADVMNPMQREFVRMAQIYKARMIAEMELTQRILERTLIEDPANDDEERAEIMREIHTQALAKWKTAWEGVLESQKDTAETWTEIVGPVIFGFKEPESVTGFVVSYRRFFDLASNPSSKLTDVEEALSAFKNAWNSEDLSSELNGTQRGVVNKSKLVEQAERFFENRRNAALALIEAEAFAEMTRGDLNHRKLLNLLIDEHEDKLMELIEGTRAHISVMDNYLKRLAVAIEDDMKTQFYEPAFVRIRLAARDTQVNLGQVERTSILTNNRALAKVLPGATIEFDLPKRQIALLEAFNGAKAMMQDYGALMNDPTFLAAFQMMGGTQMPSKVENVLPGLSSQTDAQTMGLVPRDSGQSESALQALVPDPSIFKLETGTGFQIRPVILPDGDSVIYDFDYMYTTNIREPVRADEKHLGRVKRHFVHTQVQTSSFELREISSYQVALKVSRTSRGVPLLEDIPILGAAFRPAPSDESSIQQNIILGRTTVYPTMFDLMGLRWARHVVDVNHESLLDSEHIVRGRRRTIHDYVFDTASARVDEILKLEKEHDAHFRPDLYHRRRQPSPYHPGGYTYGGQANPNHQAGPATQPIHDPTGRSFERVDRRPPEMQQPPYDLYRHTPVPPEPVELGPAAQPAGSTPFPNPVSLAPEPRMAAPMPSTRVR